MCLCFLKTDRNRQQMTISIHRLRNVQTAWFLADNRKESSPKRATWNAKKRLSENQTDAWAAKNVIERIEVLRVMTCSFLCMKILKTFGIIEGSFPIMQLTDINLPIMLHKWQLLRT